MSTDRKWEALKARNHEFAGMSRHIVAKKRRNLPPQLPCDVGLFSDDADQLDLVEMLQSPENDD